MLDKVTEDEAVKNALDEMVKNSGVEFIGTVLEDKNIRAYDLVGEPIIELPEDLSSELSMNSAVNLTMSR